MLQPEFITRLSLSCRVLWVVFLLNHSSGVAQGLPVDPQKLSILLYDIYDLKFDDFERGMIDLKEEDKNIRPLLRIFALRWREVPVAFSPSKLKYHELLLKEAGELEKEKQLTPLSSYFKICTYLFLSEYHSSLQENWTALKYAQKAYPFLIESFDKNYSEPEYQFIKGLYSYYVEYYKQKSLFYRAALVPLRSGDKKKGIQLLKSASEKPSLAQVEAQIFLAHILLHLEDKPFEAIAISKRLSETHPENLKFKELYADNLIRCKMYIEAIPLVKQLEDQKSNYYSIPAHLFKGVIEQEYFKNNEKAKKAYSQCVEQKYKPVEFYQRVASQRLKKL